MTKKLWPKLDNDLGPKRHTMPCTKEVVDVSSVYDASAIDIGEHTLRNLSRGYGRHRG